MKAPRASVYRAFLDAESVKRWMVPDGMTSEVHTFEPKEGGSFRISLTYDSPTGTGKTTADTDTFKGRFVELIPDALVVQVIEFETEDAQLKGPMKVTIMISDAEDGGTDVVAVHERLPAGLSAKDNEAGWKMSLGKLAKLLQTP